eukprot:COSAG05_NODE_21175_length_274_cov_0.554286_1_plen_38_part_01
MPCLGSKRCEALVLRPDVVLNQLTDDDKDAAAWVAAEW